MFGSLKLGKFFGIDTYIHGTFWLLPLLVLFQTFGAGLDAIAFYLLLVFAVFVCVALHEMGHALAARAYGIGTRHITLYPIGGVAMLERVPEKPWREVAVALAGPAVNVVIALGLLAVIAASGFGLAWGFYEYDVEAWVNQLLWANVILVAFNLLPCFPMDGGRVLRALLSVRLSRLRATEVAVRVGAVVAVAMFAAGVVFGKFALLAIGVVMLLLGQAELAGVRITEAAREFEARARGMFGGAADPEPEATPLPVDAAADLAARRFSGLAWDEKRRVWVQWLNGVPVRDLPT
jgi:Zn-dependent protease